MKLIQILALVTAIATVAAAQNTSAGGPQTGGKSPSATPTPGTVKSSPAKRPQPTGVKPPAGPAPAPTATSGNIGKNASGTTATGAKPGGTATGTNATGAKPGGTAIGTKASTTKGGTVKGIQGVPTASKTGSAATTKTGPPVGVARKGSTGLVKTGRTQAVKTIKPVAAAKTAKRAPKIRAKSAAKTAPAAAPATPVAVVAARPRLGALGRRDPFVSPIRMAGPSGPGASCSTGKRCLSINELVLAGTVKDISGKMMAVVVNSAKKTYTLRENDQVFNGSVEKITTDSVIFREFVKDAIGHESAREVVRKMNPGPVL